MSRVLIVGNDVSDAGQVGLALISGSALMQRHGPACAPGLWTIRHFEHSNHRTAAAARAVIDDFGTLREVAQ